MSNYFENETITYIPKKASKFEFIYDKIEIKYFKVTSYILSNWFRTEGIFILRFLWFFIFLTMFVASFCIELSFLICKGLVILAYKIIKHIAIWTLDIVGSILKSILKKFLGPVCILLGVVVCYYLYQIGILAEVGIWIKNLFFKMIEGT